MYTNKKSGKMKPLARSCKSRSSVSDSIAIVQHRPFSMYMFLCSAAKNPQENSSQIATGKKAEHKRCKTREAEITKAAQKVDIIVVVRSLHGPVETEESSTKTLCSRRKQRCHEERRRKKKRSAFVGKEEMYSVQGHIPSHGCDVM
jgi:hypothetical protein